MIIKSDQIPTALELIPDYISLCDLFVFFLQFFYILIARIAKHLYLNIIMIPYHFLKSIYIPKTFQLTYLFANAVICEINNGEVVCFVCLLTRFLQAIRRR